MQEKAASTGGKQKSCGCAACLGLCWRVNSVQTTRPDKKQQQQLRMHAVPGKKLWGDDELSCAATH
ncbi:hypothetical protein U9M48_022285 [Paspalum notatum var. saurae]|uniref:Uncharacterized protein n=1 Tax=Paspalum notatum var. saurae TaxID=547442 RepID=A0AAQ3TJF9_PASNO